MSRAVEQSVASKDRSNIGSGCLRFALLISLMIPGVGLGADADKVDFNFQIRPLLSDRCFSCHGPDQKARKAKMRLDTREGALKELDDGWAVIKPGNPSKSELVRRIFATDPDDQMPPPDSNRSLSSAEKELLKRWIAEGAEYKPHWAFIPVQPVAVPKLKSKPESQNPIDAFVCAKLEKEKLQLSPEASRETLIRRLAFDLTGLPPAVSEIEAFVNDKSADAYEKVVDRYLNSPAYGERMALDWLDLARYADTYGYQEDAERDMSPWRDWVIRAFNDNLPYDQFLTWQLAGDLLPHPTRDQIVATAFNRLHRQTDEGGSIDEEFRVEYVADRVNTVGTAMLGLTMGCARCHDHKFDPISQRDYYSMGAFFNSIDEFGLYSHFTHATPGPALLLWPDGVEKKATQLKLRILEAEDLIAYIRSNSVPDFRKWLDADGRFVTPAPIARFTFDIVNSNTTPDSVSTTNNATLVDEPKLVSGHNGNALQFSGDNEVICQSVREFKRTDEFSIGLWLKPTTLQDRAVILHQSRAWSDSGSRGFELVLDHGRPFFGLIHFWPGNAAAVRAKVVLPTNEWSQITVTYDGSSKAAGIQLYLNGRLMETEVVRDNLYKDIVHRKEWGDMEAGKIKLQLAGRFRDSGFKDGLIDDLQLFDQKLTQLEVVSAAGLPDAAKDNAPWIFTSQVDYYLAHHSSQYHEAWEKLRTLREEENDLVNDVPEIMVMREMDRPRPTFLLKRGAYDAPGDQVQRDTPSSIFPFPKDLPRDRLGFARWLVDRRNPLTSRVVVNRIWRLHFGRGLVASEEDFGGQGSLPTHPQLLDWLAGWFMDHNWDVKALHRLIVTSATYRQTSRASRELLEQDPDNRLLARGPKHRLQAEEIRDSALAASELLNRTIGGPSVKPYQPAGLWEQSGTGKKYTQDHGEKLYRRSLYTFWRRTSPPPSMLAFDAITREVCTAKRETTTTPLQALVLLNDPQFVEASRVLSERLLKQYPDDVDARVRDVFLRLTGRTPDEKEEAVLKQLYGEQKALFAAAPESAEKLLNTGESKWDQSLSRAEFAATTSLVSAVMNLDEFVVER